MLFAETFRSFAFAFLLLDITTKKEGSEFNCILMAGTSDYGYVKCWKLVSTIRCCDQSWKKIEMKWKGNKWTENFVKLLHESLACWYNFMLNCRRVDHLLSVSCSTKKLSKIWTKHFWNAKIKIRFPFGKYFSPSSSIHCWTSLFFAQTTNVFYMNSCELNDLLISCFSNAKQCMNQTSLTRSFIPLRNLAQLCKNYWFGNVSAFTCDEVFWWTR